MVNERVQRHTIHEGLHQVVSAVQAALVVPGLSPVAREFLRRFLDAAGHLESTLGGIRSSLVPVEILDNAQAHLTQASSAIEAFANDQNEGYLATADGHLDKALIQFGALPAPPFRVRERALIESAERYLAGITDAYTSLVDKIRSESEAFEGASSQLRETLDASLQSTTLRLQELRTTADQSSASISKETEERIAELRTEITSQKARLDEALTQYQTQFSAAQERRLEEFAQTLKRLESQFTEAAHALIEEVGSEHKQLTERAQAITTAAEENQKRTAQVLGFAAATNVAQAYLSEASEQKREADAWRLLAFGLVFALTIAAVVIAVLSPPQADFDTSDYVRYGVTKLPLFIFLGPAIRLALGQSSQHRRRETAARRRGQELTSFRPFLAELDDVERRKLTVDAAPRFFRGDDRPLDSSNDP